jgi:CRISPR-associated Csx10 family RAMP protein
LLDRIRFGNLYPANFKSQELSDDEQPVYPLPTTARSCKRFDGFLFGAKKELEIRHGVFDHLIPWSLFALSQQKYKTALDVTKICRYNQSDGSTECGQNIDRFAGFYRRGLDAAEIGKAEVNKGIRTRTGISRLTGAAAEAILYSREILSEGRKFWGTIMVDDALYPGLSSFIEEAVQAGLLRLGNNRTRGLGRLGWFDFQQQPTETADELAERAVAFDRKLRQAADTAGVATPHGFYLPVTLVSDTILYDNLLRHQLQLSGDYLENIWEISGAELIYHNAGRRQVMGWSNVWGLPKADEWAISMGSVFLFGLPDRPDFEHLICMQHQGVGARLSEGFGQVHLADPFHQEVDPL